VVYTLRLLVTQRERAPSTFGDFRFTARRTKKMSLSNASTVVGHQTFVAGVAKNIFIALDGVAGAYYADISTVHSI